MIDYIVYLILCNFIWFINDKLVKSRKTPYFCHPALSYLSAWIQFLNWLQSFWTPVFTGVTTFYETIINNLLEKLYGNHRNR